VDGSLRLLVRATVTSLRSASDPRLILGNVNAFEKGALEALAGRRKRLGLKKPFFKQV
jgi:hypothetical protein